MRTPRLLRLLFLPLLLLCQGMALGAYVDNVLLTPASAPVGTAATVRVTARIADPTVVPNSLNLQRVDPQGRAVLVGDLRDDGLAGDEAANDGTYSLQFTVMEERPGPLTYRVSAGVRGKLLRVFSNPATFNVTGAFGTGVSITQPANLVFVNQSPVIVAGTTGDPNAAVTVNSIQATKNGTAFQTTVPLQEGNNTITAVATNSNGTDSTTSIQVTLDTTPPRVTVDSPPNGFSTTEPGITVSGIVNDIVVGTVNSQQARVTVNGAAAAVVNRTYAAAVPLQLGQNSIQVIGRDQTGNSATTSVTVTRQAVTEPYIRLVSGNNQSAAIGAALPAPLIVQVLNGTTPVPNATVIFKVTESDGFLQPGTGKPQLITVTTNAQGQARAGWTLGNRAGAGNNTVEAYAGGYQGTAVFTASATAAAPAQIVVDTGNNQFGAVNKPLPLPLVAIVTDSGFNRLGGVPVTFTVKQGGGSFNGAATYKANSDSDGRVLALLTLGSEPGQDNNVVEASFPGLATLAAAFTASGRIPGDPAQTSITGVVLDNSNNPIPDVTMRLFQPYQGTSNNQHVQVGDPVLTDAAGTFAIAPAPVGVFKLMADGTTATLSGQQFPTLEYDIVTVAGQENTVGMPIYLPALDPNARVCVSPTTGGVLTMASSPGFSLTIAAGSATFPGGSKTGCVSVTPVNPDKVPMAPGFGQQPRYIVTIQPVGTVFNPPAPMTIPNMDGLAPKAKTEMYSYDHDLAAFVAIGSGTVSADGSVIASDPGIGVIKAGWHCGGNPSTSGSAGTCAECQKCQGTNCVADAGKNDTCCGGATSICKTGSCSEVKLDAAEGKVNGKDKDVVAFKTGGVPVSFTGTATGNNCDYSYYWDFGDGQTSNAQSPTHSYMHGGEFSINFKASCKKCSPPEKTVTLDLTVVEVEKIQNQVGTKAGSYRDFAGVLRILFGKEVFLKAIPNPSSATFPSGSPEWEGTYGANGLGVETSHIYAGAPSSSDSDTKTVRTKSGPTNPEKVLICANVLGIHSNKPPNAGFTDGHAWISVHDYSSGSATTITYGLWPDSHPRVVAAGLNGPGSDVRVGFEPPSGLYNRYYLVCPSQRTSLNSYITSYAEWGYLNTCANWAEDATKAAVGETVSSSDFVLFGTPRAISKSIQSLESTTPTSQDKPLNGGEDATSSAPGDSSFGGSSFP